MSSTTVRRPTTSTSFGTWTFGGGATTVEGATSDNTVTTYARANATNTIAFVNYDAYSIPGGSIITSVTLKAQVFGPGTLPGGGFGAYLQQPGGVLSQQLTYNTHPPATAGTNYSWTVTTQADGSPWTAAAVNTLQTRFICNNLVGLVRLEMDVVHNQQPTLSSVTATLTGQVAAITYNYADPDADMQERHVVKIFTNAVKVGAGFDPETSAFVASSGEEFTNVEGWTSPALNPGTYWAYAKVADAGSNGRYSSWVGTASSFAITSLVAAPTIVSVTPDPTNVRNVVIVAAAETDILTGDAQTWEGGTAGSWTTDTGMTSVANTTAQAHTGTHALRLTCSGAGNGVAQSAISGAASAAPNRVYTFSCWFRPNTTARFVFVQLQFLTSASGVISTVSSATNPAETAATWVQATVTATAPATTDRLRVKAAIISPAAAEIHDIDDADLVRIFPNSNAQVERSDDGGITWTIVRNTEANNYDPITRQVTVYDYEATNNVLATYRAATMGTDDLGAPLASPYSSTLTATLTVTKFYLVDPFTQTVLAFQQMGDLPVVSTTPEGVFAPIGRSREVVLSDASKGDHLSLVMFLKDGATYDQFEAMRKRNNVLFLQTPWRRSWQIRLGAQRSGTALNSYGHVSDNGRWRVEIEAIEVTRPT